MGKAVIYEIISKGPFSDGDASKKRKQIELVSGATITDLGMGDKNEAAEDMQVRTVSGTEAAIVMAAGATLSTTVEFIR